MFYIYLIGFTSLDCWDVASPWHFIFRNIPLVIQVREVKKNPYPPTVFLGLINARWFISMADISKAPRTNQIPLTVIPSAELTSCWSEILEAEKLKTKREV